MFSISKIKISTEKKIKITRNSPTTAAACLPLKTCCWISPCNFPILSSFRPHTLRTALDREASHSEASLGSCGPFRTKHFPFFPMLQGWELTISSEWHVTPCLTFRRLLGKPPPRGGSFLSLFRFQMYPTHPTLHPTLFILSFPICAAAMRPPCHSSTDRMPHSLPVPLTCVFYFCPLFLVSN